MITGDRAEYVNDWIHKNAQAYAEAKAERIYLQEFRKTKKAILVSERQGTVLERESFAYSHPDYVAILEGIKVAVVEEETLLWKKTAAQNEIEMYRTQQANQRQGY